MLHFYLLFVKRVRQFHEDIPLLSSIVPSPVPRGHASFYPRSPFLGFTLPTEYFLRPAIFIYFIILDSCWLVGTDGKPSPLTPTQKVRSLLYWVIEYI
jgi:hypothetical protein